MKKKPQHPPRAWLLVPGGALAGAWEQEMSPGGDTVSIRITSHCRDVSWDRVVIRRGGLFQRGGLFPSWGRDGNLERIRDYFGEGDYFPVAAAGSRSLNFPAPFPALTSAQCAFGYVAPLRASAPNSPNCH